MTLDKKTQSLVNKLVKKFDTIKSKQVQDKKLNDLQLWWDNVNLIFVLITDREEDYEGSQSQIGIAKDGSIRWEYQSHCSCNSYEDSTALGDELLPELTKKSWQLNEIPEDWELQIQKNIEILLKNV